MKGGARMKAKAIEYLNSLILESTPKAELDLIEFAKKCVREYKEKEPKVKVGFVPPTKQEVADYVASKGYYVDVDKFYEYYTVAEWHDKLGKPVKNWKLKLLVWKQDTNEKQQFIKNNYTKQQIDDLITNLDEVEV